MASMADRQHGKHGRYPAQKRPVEDKFLLATGEGKLRQLPMPAGGSLKRGQSCSQIWPLHGIGKQCNLDPGRPV